MDLSETLLRIVATVRLLPCSFSMDWKSLR